MMEEGTAGRLGRSTSPFFSQVLSTSRAETVDYFVFHRRVGATAIFPRDSKELRETNEER